MNPSQRPVPSSDDHENRAGSHKDRPSQNDDFGKIALTSSLQKPLSSDIPKSLSKVMPETSLNLATKERTLKDFEAENLKKYWNDKCRQYDHRSLFLFDYRCHFRQLIIRLLNWKYYDQLMILTIMGNSICLALTDYSDENNDSEWNKRLDYIDQIFTVYYIVEAALKIIAFGFILHKKSYLRDPWNVVDFIVVVIGIISLIPAFPNLKSLRIMRVLRPLRSINAVPSMKRLVQTLLMSLPQMGYLVSFLLFFITVFAILGMQLFARDLYARCRFTDEPIKDVNGTWSWPADPTQQRPCGGYYQCAAGTYCHHLNERGIPLDADLVDQWEQIQYGYFQFDNIGSAILAIFRVITLEGWTGYMYNYLDSSGFIACIYFPILVVMGSFFFLNLFLAVITDTFSENSQKQIRLEEESNMTIDEDKQKTSPSTSKDQAVANMMNLSKKKAMITRGGRGSLTDAAMMALAQQRMIEQQEKEEAEAASSARQQLVQITHLNEPMPKIPQEPQNEVSKTEEKGSNLSNQVLETPSNQTDLENLSLNIKIQRMLYWLCMSFAYVLFINLCIVANTVCLALDYYPTNNELQSVLDIFNIVFFAIFFMELVIKILGLGPVVFIRDFYNIFDSLIVILSVVDVSLSYSMAASSDDGFSGKGAISAFRAFRLLRVFKMAKSWKQLNSLIQTIAKSLKDISSFSILLFLLMFIYILLGMQIFAQSKDSSYYNNGLKPPRNNFKNFLNGFILVFTVLTGENWDSTMFQFARSHGYIAILYFISLVIIGVMIFLNLFLAILLENFEEGKDEEDEGKKEAGSFLAGVVKQMKGWVAAKCCRKASEELGEVKQEQTREAAAVVSNQLGGDVKKTGTTYQEEKITKQRQIGLENTLQNVRDSLEGSIHNGLNKNSSQNQLVYLPDYTRNPHQDIYEDSTNPYMKSPSITIGALTLKQERAPRNILGAMSIRDDQDETLRCQQQQNTPFISHQNQDNMTLTGRAKAGQGSIAEFSENAGGLDNPAEMDLEEQESIRKLDFDEFNNTNVQLLTFNQNERAREESAQRMNKNGCPPEFNAQDSVPRSNFGGSAGAAGPQNRATKSIALLILQKGIEKQQASQFLGNNKIMRCEGNSLIIMGPDNWFRLQITMFVKSPKFDMFILLLIAISSILLALDNPLNDPNSDLTSFLKYSDYILTSFFLAESLLKIIAFGLLFNGEISYLRNGWNAIDFTVVIISLASLVISGNKFKIVKIFRLLRILRPLRVISKNKGLKIGIQALFSAIPRLFNVTIISLLFFIICGIIGITYFKGSFYSCYFGPSFPQELNDDTYEYVKTKFECLNLGGTWKNADSHFDNMAEAISTMFQMSTTEGWIDVMNNGIDSVGIDMQPIIENNVYWSFFFMVFIFFGNFLILNLFTGVVCDTYNNEKEILGKNYLLSDNQKMWLQYKKQCMNLTPKFKVHQENIGGCRHKIHSFTTSRKFELFILICIMLNTVTLCINWYSQTVQIDDMLDYINYGFAVIFALEAILKIISFGFKAYVRDRGNIFDFLIVILTIVTSIISITMELDFGASTTFIRALRMSRIFKFIQKSKQIKVIFETLIVTIPAITNIGGLLLLLLYMFSVLGVFLFADVQLQSTLDSHANFQSFGIAFLTLLRCSTGEAWNSLMLDTMRQRSILFQCSEEDFDFDTYVMNGRQTNGCGSGPAGIIFFIAYFLLVPLFFLDLFVAIILEGFEQTSKQANNLIQEEHLDQFREAWLEYDPDGTGFIKIRDFADFMLKLGRPLGWNDEFKGRFDLQDDFMEELNISTYGNFQDFQFYDVIEGLIKVYLVNHEVRKIAAGLGTDDSFHTDSSMGEEDMEQDDDQASPGPKVERDGGIHSQISPSRRPRRQLNLHYHNEEKVRLRLELEFESLDDERQDVMDVEEIKAKQDRLMRPFKSKQDPTFTSAHFKAARKIVLALRRLQNRKKINETAAIYGVDSSYFTQGITSTKPLNLEQEESNQKQLQAGFGGQNKGLYQKFQSRANKSMRFDQESQLEPILEEEIKKQGDGNVGSNLILKTSAARENQGFFDNQGRGRNAAAGDADAIIQDYQDELERQGGRGGVAPAAVGASKRAPIMQELTSLDERSNDAQQDQNIKIPLSHPKEVWADSDRENNSQMQVKGTLVKDLNVKNQLYKRGGTTVVANGTSRAGASRDYDSESQLGGGGQSIDASNHTPGGAQNNQQQAITKPSQPHAPEFFYPDHNSSSMQ